jgi:hypothetical protein
MEVVAHGLLTAAAGIAANRSIKTRIRIGWLVWWGVFPDVAAFGPAIVIGLALRLMGGAAVVPPHGHFVPHFRIGLPLYAAAHSLVVFTLVFAIAALLARRPVYAMLGWLLHILIDIPTHSLSYYATRFLWPVSDVRVDGIAWWTPWFWVATYAAIVVAYVVMWKRGWLRRGRSSPESAGG